MSPNESQNLTKDQKFLGIFWNSNSDTLLFSIESPSEFEPITKRKLLSMIGHLYDPLGLLSPLIVKENFNATNLERIFRLGWCSF